MTHPLQQSRFLSAFQCLGDTCEDTCCKGWGMQLTKETVDRYKAEAPELMNAVTSGEAEFIMRRDPNTDYCVKFDAGWCGIHRDYGTAFLGDACHFFPRITRKLGDRNLMTASLSCPEIARLAVLEGAGFEWDGTAAERLPFSLKDYLPESMSADAAWEIHRAFVEMGGSEQAGPLTLTLSPSGRGNAQSGAASVKDNPLPGERVARRAGEGQGLTPERIIARLRSIAVSLQSQDKANWAMAVPFYLKNADSRLPAPEMNAADPFNLLNALQGLIGASRATKRPRLEQTIADMEKALAVTLDWEKLSIQLSDGSLAAWQAMQTYWREHHADYFNPILCRWIQTELSMALFPFAGLGDTLVDRVTILGVRFATLKLALMSACYVHGIHLSDDVPGPEMDPGVRRDDGLSPEETVRIIQSLSRFLDHLADPALSLQIYTETGWVREARLRALIGDIN